MRNSILYLVLGIGICAFCSCQSGKTETYHSLPAVKFGGEKWEGFNCAAPPYPFKENPMPQIAKTGANAISVIPYGFSYTGEPTLRFNWERQWWGEKDEGVKEQIRLAKEQGFRVMLKPQIWVMGDAWIGSLDFETEEQRQIWEGELKTYVLHFAKIAEEMEVELFCFATEIKKFAQGRRPFWEELIAEIRNHYPGKITYAANWDNIEKVCFWDLVDFIGVDAYFPLSPKKNPQAEHIVKGWKSAKTQLEQLNKQFGKPILFTEWGYLSVEKCAWNHWEAEHNLGAYPPSEDCQLEAYSAFFKTFWNQDWVAGGFIWKWQYFPGYGDGDPKKTFSPQGKKAMQAIEKVYQP